MTEEREDDYLVIVRAQVMTRDESTEGWLPLAGGGLANVSIRKRARLPPDVGAHEYIIYGQRISDQTVILSCAINGDLQYFKVMPTFHHWRAGKQRNGLTFQTAADARAFDKGIIRAYSELIDGMSDTWSSPYKYNNQVEEDDVFMTLNLPLDPSGSRSTSEGSCEKITAERKVKSHYPVSSSGRVAMATTTTSVTSKTMSPPLQQQQQHNIHIISLSPAASAAANGTNTAATDPLSEQPNSIAPGDNYSYVQLTSVTDFTFPPSAADDATSNNTNSGQVNASIRRDSVGSLKKRCAAEAAAAAAAVGGPGAQGGGGASGGQPMMRMRLRCRYCQEFYTEEWNRRGACDYAPDCVRKGLDSLALMTCARCLLYHCMSDAEGDTVQHPCECTQEVGCIKRWIGIALLSLMVPCLCFYPPLRACHWIGVSCGVCGGKHKPQM